MKKPEIDDYPRTDELSYYYMNGAVNWEKYAKALDKYIKQLTETQ